MSAAREEILARVRGALREPVPDEEAGEGAAAAYAVASPLSHAEAVARFAERAAEHRAGVRRVGPGEVARAVAEACAAHGARRIAVPADLPAEWLPGGLEPVADHGIPTAELDGLDGVLTGSALAIADTGTVVLDAGPGQGRRALTLVPDLHVCVVRADAVVRSVPEAVRALEAGVRDHGRPLTLISGPSATSDIELRRVEGVHGPRRLELLVAG